MSYNQDDAQSCYSSAFSVATTIGGSTTKPRAKRPRKPKPVASVKPEEPQKPSFSAELVQQGLSQLGKTADGLRSAYLRLEITGTNLASTEPVVGLKDLQVLVLKENELSDLSTLQQLPNLTSLDASRNKLTKVLGFGIPDNGSNLRVADLSSNMIQMVPDLSRFKRLSKLNLDRNQLESMAGLGSLPMLSSLSLAGNRLTTLQGLHQLTGLRHLNVEDNKLRSLSPVGHLPSLEVLQAARNAITSLKDLKGLVRLQQLDVTDNQMHNLNDLAACQSASLLCDLKVRGNPLCLGMSCRLHLVYLLPQVAVLDGVEVSAQEKVQSANLHGADAEDLRRIRRRYFPDGELDDGGGALPPPSAGLVASCAEEEIQDTQAVSQAFLRIDAWARSVPVPKLVAVDLLGEDGTGTHTQNAEEPHSSKAGAVLLALAQHLSSTCTGQLQLARVCLEWVASHITPPTDAFGPASVHAPLFASQAPPAASTRAPRRSNPASRPGTAPDVPVVAPPDVETQLLRGQKGTWSERAALLFTLLAKACELEAVAIPGYCKALGIPPGEARAAHNHCWAGVKVGGRWRLVDPALAALTSGSCSTTARPFFVPPQAWIYSYFPLEAHWQLLLDPISLELWWDMPLLSVGFFARGLKLISPEALMAVNTQSAPREGGQYPCLEVCVAAPVTPTTRLRHVLRSMTTGSVVAAWTGPLTRADGSEGGAAVNLAYQQVDLGDGSVSMVQFGASTYASHKHRLITSFPASGEYILEVHHVSDIPGGLPVHIQGLPAPLVLRLEESEVVLQTKVIVPDIEPHDPEEGLLHNSEVVICPQPSVHPQFVHIGAQLLSPGVGTRLEADRTYVFQLLAPSNANLQASADSKFAVPLRPATTSEDSSSTGFGGCYLAQTASGLPPVAPASNSRPPSGSAGNRPTSANNGPTSATSRNSTAAGAAGSTANRPHSGSRHQSSSASGGMIVYEAKVTVPRQTHLHIKAHTHIPELGCCGWLPLLTFPIAPQSQHIVDSYYEPDIPLVEMDDPQATHAAELFRTMDMNNDGKVTRAELLCALRKREQQQVADPLQIPAVVHAHDGTLEMFVDRFLSIDTGKLGAFNFSELCLHLGVKPSEVVLSDEEYDEDEEYEDEEGEYHGEHGGDSRPVSPVLVEEAELVN